MKVYVSVDMEGISGLADSSDVTPGSPEYERGREQMTADANAAIEGAFDGGAESVLVNDSHDGMHNLLMDRIDRRARVIRGYEKPQAMVEGLDGSFAASFFVGYHAAAGTAGAVLNHTLMGGPIHNVYLNGEPAGETRLNAALAGYHGVPVALVTGDDAVCDEARRLLGAVETVEVKTGIDKYTANLLHPDVARDEIRASASRALADLERFTPYVVEPPVTLGVEWNSTTIASICELIPGVNLAGPRAVEFTTSTYPEIIGLLRVMIFVAAQVANRPFSYD